MPFTLHHLAHTKRFRIRLAEHYFHLFSHPRFFAHIHAFHTHKPDTRLPDSMLSSIASSGRADPATLFSTLESCESGLIQDEAATRLEHYGSNEVIHEKPLPWWQALWFSYCNPFSLLLTALAIISAFTDDIPGAFVISGMILLATLIRFTQERRSHEAASQLKALITPTCTVLRRDNPLEAGIKIDIPSKDLVPGDIVFLSSGDIVPADLRLLKVKDLLINQAMLTGESAPVEKNASPAVQDASSPLEMSSLCFMGTNVLSGTGAAIVLATGNSTYFGVLAQRVGSVKREPTQFQAGINKVSWLLLSFMAVMAPFVLFINGFTKGNWTDAILFALSVAVGLTPEMLPMIVSSTLAKGAVLLSRKKVVVKRLDAIQDFGAMDTLCTDKTGTLTQGQITLSRYADAFGQPNEHPLEQGVLNSFFQTGLKNQMDIAITDYGNAKGMKEICSAWEKCDELPFDFNRRRMSVILSKDNQTRLICKGAFEETLAICTHVWKNGSVSPLADEERRQARQIATSWNTEGLRVVAIAEKEIPAGQDVFSNNDESGLVLIGYLAFLDPAKESSGEALAALRKNGIAIKILTGDNELVSRKICADVGLEVDGVLQGDAVDALNDEELAVAVEKITVFSKLSPLHKERLVRVLRHKGHVVGFMGDGINDAPALHAADVGISVNTAVDVAKDAADLILLEKSLMVLDEGVVEGRKIFVNMLKYIKMTASSNFGNVFSVLIASICLPFLPMLPLHLLVQNLLYDISQIGIPFDNVDKELLAKPQRWNADVIKRFMVWFGPVSSVFDVATFCLMWFVFHATTEAQQTLFQSGWFVEGLLSQTLIVHMIRTQKIPFIQSRASTPLLLATLSVMCVGVCIPMSGLASYFRLQALPLEYFGWLALILLSYMMLTQRIKRIYIARFGWQ